MKNPNAPRPALWRPGTRLRLKVEHTEEWQAAIVEINPRRRAELERRARANREVFRYAEPARIGIVAADSAGTLRNLFPVCFYEEVKR